MSFRVEFTNVVGYRVLDERDLPHLTAAAAKVPQSIVFEVFSGGWADDVNSHSPIMRAGFYPQVREWFVRTEAWCLSVLSETEPGVTKRHSAEH